MDYITFFTFLLSIYLVNSIIVHTQYGTIQGKIRKSRAANSHVRYYYFANVPYARPPIDELRFKEPQPPDNWKGVRDASKAGNFCTQIEDQFIGSNVLGSEDCLYLEISVPVSVRKMYKKFPVLVWIHGGSFAFSSYQETGPDYFMAKNVVLVQIQYRLSVFGFLTTNDEHAVGNIGLKDQVFALRWIQNNIANFGGDPNKVTIFGASAGGASVQLHMVSPQSAGLFHRAISQSGISLNTWTFQRHPVKMVKRLAQGLKIDFNDNKELVQKLQKVDADVLIKAAFNQTIMGFFIPFDEIPFLPSIEPDSDAAFLSGSAYELLQKGEFRNVPYMLGHTTEEGSFPYSYVDLGYLNINLYDQYPELVVPTSMNIPPNSPDWKSSIGEIRQFYFNNSSFTTKNDWINLMGQDKRGVKKAVELMCNIKKNFDPYFYVFSYVGNNNLSYAGGAGHYSDVLHMFYPQKSDWTTDETKSDKLVRKRLVELWTNFAYFGNPTVRKKRLLEYTRWSTYCSKKVYLNIGDQLTLYQNPDEKMYEFWVQLFNKYGYPPYLTY